MRIPFRTGLLLACLAVAGAAPAPAANQIKIDNFTFSPAKLMIAKGGAVTWTNHDDIPHTVVLGSIGVRSQALDTDAAYAHTFEKAGIFNYVCGLHPQMHGQIVVR